MAKQYRVGIIGRTGRGNYGHNLDLAWKTHPRAQIIAVADDDPEGLKKASQRLGAKASYADWRQMLKQEKPEVVVIAMRWVDCHEEMVIAAAESGASIFMEKPMARTLAECDRMIDACDRTHVRMVVAHNMRCCPILDYVQEKVKSGVIGDLLEIRARGKEDKRSGGEDLMVLGTHMFDLMRRFGGDPVWAFGQVTVEGRDIKREDVNRQGPEGLGAIAGDSIAGVYGFPGGLNGYFASRKSSDISGKRWGADLVGSVGILRIKADHVPEIWMSPSLLSRSAEWRRMEIPQGVGPKDAESANQLLIDDLLDAIEQRREPAAGGRTARWTIEMAHALYASQRSSGRVRLPLEKRENPLLL